MANTVLIITNDLDIHADAVILELHKRDVPVFRFHPDEFPQACRISIEIQDGLMRGEIATRHRSVALSDICAVWFRRSAGMFEESISFTSTELRDYIKQQSKATLAALYEGLGTFWVGHPQKLLRANIKALQLAEASKAGLQTPHTLISNDPTKAAAFVDSLGETECAIKPLCAKGVTDEQGYHLPLTTTLPKGHCLDSVALAPNIFQPYIPKAAELRCVVIGDKIFSAKIDSQVNEQTRKDWRAGDTHLERFALPQQVETAIHRLMDSFELNFASLDMILTPQGEHVFLELNPNGQWLWIEEELGLPLVATMADLLTTYHPSKWEPDVKSALPVS